MPKNNNPIPADEQRVTIRLPRTLYSTLRSQLVLKNTNFTKWVKGHVIAEIETAAKSAAS